jgi:putative isomerase
MPTMKPPTGWNTWGFESYVTFAFLDEGVRRTRVRIAFYDPETMTTHDDFWWPDVERLGDHAWNGAYVSLGLRAGAGIFDIEAAADGTTLWGRITPRGATRQQIVVVLTPDGPTSWERGKGRLVAGEWALGFHGATHNEALFLNINEPYVVGKPGGAVSFVCAPKRRKVNVSNAAGKLAQAKKAYRADAATGSGLLDDVPEGVVRGATWNTVYDPYRFGVCTPVSRAWSRHWGGVCVFDWDTFFAAVLSTLESPELAWSNLNAVLSSVEVLGFVPNYAVSHGGLSLDRSQPPVGALCTWKVYCLAPDKARLRALYPKLLRWHRWWWRHRDGNGDGLLEWGSDAERYVYPFLDGQLGNAQLINERQYAAFESGLDNSPVFDDAEFDPASRTLTLATVDLNAMLCADSELLARIARECGDEKTARALDREHAAHAARINALMWSDKHGAYLNRTWDGRLAQVLTPMIFYPLMAGVPTEAQAERLVNEHLLNPDEFWGDCVIPSVARNHPAFADNDYWRGRIWGPMNLLVAEGLARYRFDEVAYEFAKRSLGPFADNWRRLNRVYENYNGATGIGGDVRSADELYHWGGLLGAIMVRQLVDVEPDGALRLGTLGTDELCVANVPVRGRRYAVRTSAKGLVVERDGRKLLTTDRPAILRRVEIKARTVRFDLYCAGPEIRITFFGLKPNAAYAIELSGSRLAAETNAGGVLRVDYTERSGE